MGFGHNLYPSYAQEFSCVGNVMTYAYACANVGCYLYSDQPRLLKHSYYGMYLYIHIHRQILTVLFIY